MDRNENSFDKALREAISVLGDAWTLRILAVMMSGEGRFNDLKKRLEISPRVLSERLLRMEEGGLVVRQAYQEDGQRVRQEYRLTARGRAAKGVLRAFAGWGAGI